MQAEWSFVPVSLHVFLGTRPLQNIGSRDEIKEGGLTPKFYICNDIKRVHTERQNKADQGATKARNEAYFVGTPQ
jgi:hypothetical protein